MGGQLSNTIASDFRKFAERYSPSVTGGLLNYVLEPVLNNRTMETELIVATLNESSITMATKEFLLTNTENLRVFDILPVEVKPVGITSRRYMSGVVSGIFAIVVAFLFLLSIWIIPCVFKCGMRKIGDPSKAIRILYLVLGCITVLMSIFSIFCIPISFAATSALVNVINPNAENGIIKRLDHIFGETRKLVDDFVDNGMNLTDRTIQNVENLLRVEVGRGIDDMLNSLLDEYGVTELEQQVKLLTRDAVDVERISNSINSRATVLRDSIEGYRMRTNGFADQLFGPSESLCALPTFEQCDTLRDSISNMRLNGEISNELNAIIRTTSTVESFAQNGITNISTYFDELQKEFDKIIEQNSNETASQLDITQQSEPIKNIWSRLNELSSPAFDEMERARPTIDEYLAIAHRMVNVAGYFMSTMFLVTIVVVLVYVTFCIFEAIKQGIWPFNGGDGTTLKTTPIVGFTIPAILSSLMPVLVIFTVALFLVSCVLSNEGCRYISKPAAIKVTDAAINLLVKHEWSPLSDSIQLEPHRKRLLNLSPPRNVAAALLAKCSSDPTTSYSAPLLPKLGIANIFNTTALADQPEVEKAIKDGESQVVQTILSLNLNSILPENIDEQVAQARNLSTAFSSVNYTERIVQINSSVPTESSLNENLDHLSNLIQPLGNLPAAAQIQNTIDDLRRELRSLNSINEQLDDLLEAVEMLDTLEEWSMALDNLATKMDDFTQIIGDNRRLEQPIPKVYNATVERALNALISGLDRETTRFTQDVLYCGRINALANIAVGTICGNRGLVDRLGGLCFILLLTALPLMFTVVVFQLFLGLHQTQTDD